MIALLVALWLALTPAQPPILGYWQDDVLYLQITQPGCLTMYGNGIVSAIDLPNGCDVTSYRLSQNDPDPLLRPWGRTLVLIDTETHLEIIRWVVPPKPALWIPQITAPDATSRLVVSGLAASWVNDRLIVTAAPGCLYLTGGGRPSQWIGCDLPEYTLYPYGDQGYVPMGRTLVLVGDGVTRLDVPARVVVRLVWVMN